MPDEENHVYEARKYFDFCLKDNGKLLEGQGKWGMAFHLVST